MNTRLLKSEIIVRKSLSKAMICLVFIISFCSFQGVKEISEPTIKALFLYNFTKYIEWSAEKNPDHFIIGIYGASSVSDELKHICANKKVNNKDIEIQMINDLSQAEHCNILFIPKNQNDQLNKINTIAEVNEVLIVTEERGMAMKGAAVNIIEKDQKIRFELNESALKRARLKASSQLLSLAILVNN
jgi:hypothetical protein